MKKILAALTLTLTIVSCGTVPTDNAQVPTGDTPQAQVNEDAIISDIEARIARGELKPALVIKSQGMGGQSVGAGQYTCGIYNVVSPPGYPGGISVVTGHAYMSCNVVMRAIYMNGFIQDASTGVRSPLTSGDTINRPQYLLPLTPLSWYSGHTYCAYSAASVVFPDNPTPVMGTGQPTCI